MAENIYSRLKNAWNAFLSREPPYGYVYGASSSSRPDRFRLSRGHEKSIINSIYNRIAIDCSRVSVMHVQLDKNGRYKEELDTRLNRCLTLEANRDQTARAFMQDVVMSLFDEGCVAIAPIDTVYNPKTKSTDIVTMRTAKITQWYPDRVTLHAYNEVTGLYEDITLPKTMVAIIENPLYSIMNEPSSTLSRLIRKLNLLDVIDEQSGSGKLNLIVQLPYTVKNETRKQQAESRRQDIEQQLAESKFGVAYTDGTEKITQLNRVVENNLMEQIEYLTNMLYSQLGITTEILNGTADETAMLNYTNRTIEPIITAIVDEMKRKFISEKDRASGKTIMFLNDPFKMVPVAKVAEIADKFTRNEIMSSNEVRQIVGFKPVDDPNADELRNKNLNQSKEELANRNGVDPKNTQDSEKTENEDNG